MYSIARMLVALATVWSLLGAELTLLPPRATAAPETQFDYYGRAAQRMDAGDYQGAVEDFTRAIQGNRNNDRGRADAYVGRGNALARLGNLSGAIDHFSHALLFAHSAEAY